METSLTSNWYGALECSVPEFISNIPIKQPTGKGIYPSACLGQYLVRQSLRSVDCIYYLPLLPDWLIKAIGRELC